MNNYIIADIKRVFHKKSFFTIVSIYIGLFLLLMFIYFNPAFTAETYLAKTKTFLSFFSLFIGLIIFLSLYYDDFKSKSMQVAIGYGISRYKVVLSKFIESLLLFLVSGLCMCLIVLIIPTVLGLYLNDVQITDLVCSIMVEILRSIGYISISTIPVFYTQNAVGGSIFYVLLSSRTILIILTMILGQDFLVQIFGGLTQYLFTTQLYSIRSIFVQVGTISVSLLWTVIAYIILPTVLSVLCFNKKELEF